MGLALFLLGCGFGLGYTFCRRLQSIPLQQSKGVSDEFVIYPDVEHIPPGDIARAYDPLLDGLRRGSLERELVQLAWLDCFTGRQEDARAVIAFGLRVFPGNADLMQLRKSYKL